MCQLHQPNNIDTMSDSELKILNVVLRNDVKRAPPSTLPTSLVTLVYS